MVLDSDHKRLSRKCQPAKPSHISKPTELELKPADGISVESVTYPDPLLQQVLLRRDATESLRRRYQLKVRLKADKKAAPVNTTFPAKLRVQACDDKVCYAPGALDVLVPVNIK